MQIQEYLKENRISKYKFSKMCDLPYGTLNDICNGKTNITKCTGETLLKIANTMGCTVDDLLKEGISSYVYQIDKIKRKIIPIAKKYELKSVYLFGSYARGDANIDSDVDILIDREGSTVHGIFAMNALVNELKDALGKNVDLITTQSLNQKSSLDRNASFIESVMKERAKVYERS